MFDFIRKNKEDHETKTVEVPYRIHEIDIEGLGRQVKELIESRKKLERIIQNHVRGEITYHSEFYFVENKEWKFLSPAYSTRTYIYKNGKEYEIKGLHLSEAEIVQGAIENILWIEDVSQSNYGRLLYRRYVVDLSDCSFRQIE